jgi:hypothetical protein
VVAPNRLRSSGSRALVGCLLAVVALLAMPAAQAAAASFEDDFADMQLFSSKNSTEGAMAFFSGASKESGEPNHAGNAGGSSLWIEWTAGANQVAEIWACGISGADTLLGVYTGTAVNALTEVASNDESALPGRCAAPSSGLLFSATAGTHYKIAVDAKAASSFAILHIRTVPVNDDFANATVLPSLPSASDSVDNRIATKEPGEPDHGGHVEGHTVWYQWTAPASALTSVEACNIGASTAIGVYTGSAVNALTEIASNDDAGGLCHSGAELRFNAVEGVTYKIAIDGNEKKSAKVGWSLYAVPIKELTVEKAGSGEGTVTSEPSGIECGLLCEAPFERQTSADYFDGAARLTATPAPGSVFSGWSGSAKCDGGALVNPCAWLMGTEDATLIATFESTEAPKGDPEEGEEEEEKGKGPGSDPILPPADPPAGAPPSGGPWSPPAHPKRAKCGKRSHRVTAQRAKPCKRVKHGGKRRSQRG